MEKLRSDKMEKYGYGYELANRYVFRRKLGQGASGSVYMAFDAKLNKCWAVKVCGRLWGNEIEAIKKIDYYAFPRIVDVIRDDDVCFLVMDYIEGETLDKYRKNHSLSERQIMRMGKKIAGAMKYLHNLSPALLYMDCKPENIIVTPSGDIRLVDLGSIYICDENRSNIVSGTVFYAPKEIKESSLHKIRELDGRSDIYSLGMTLYYILMGCKTEYRDRHGRLCLRRKNKNVSRLAEKIVRKCTAINMKDRYQNINDVYEELSNASTKGVKNALSRAKVAIEPIVMKGIDILCKIVLCGGILFNANKYARFGKWEQLYISVLFGVIFLVFCKRKTVYSWENKKDIFRGAGARVLMGLIAVASAFSGVNTKAAVYENEVMTNETGEETGKDISDQNDWLKENEGIGNNQNRLDVILHDEYGRNMLIRPGAVWETDRDIQFTIPIEEISDSKCCITISYEENGAHKAYTFFCRAK